MYPGLLLNLRWLRPGVREFAPVFFVFEAFLAVFLAIFLHLLLSKVCCLLLWRRWDWYLFFEHNIDWFFYICAVLLLWLLFLCFGKFRQTNCTFPRFIHWKLCLKDPLSEVCVWERFSCCQGMWYCNMYIFHECTSGLLPVLGLGLGLGVGFCSLLLLMKGIHVYTCGCNC